MTRVPPRAQEDAIADRAPSHAREARDDNRLAQRGALLVQKLWHLRGRVNRTDTPLPSLRGKR